MALMKSAKELDTYLTHSLLSAKERGYNSPISWAWPQPVRWSFDEKWIEYTLHVDPITRNNNNVMHGGMISTLFDNAMGILANSFAEGVAPTITLSVNFVRPVRLDTDIGILAKITHRGRTLIHTEAKVWDQTDPDRLLATATGIFHVQPAVK